MVSSVSAAGLYPTGSWIGDGEVLLVVVGEQFDSVAGGGGGTTVTEEGFVVVCCAEVVPSSYRSVNE